MVSAVPLALINVAIPRVSALLGEGKRDEYERVLNDTTEKYLALVIPINFGFIVLAQEVMQLYTQDVYTYVWPVLIVAAISRIALSFQSVLNNLVMYVNSREKQQVVLLAVFGVMNLVMNFILVAVGCFTVIASLATTTLAVHTVRRDLLLLRREEDRRQLQAVFQAHMRLPAGFGAVYPAVAAHPHGGVELLGEHRGDNHRMRCAVCRIYDTY